jgi:outer membrane lipoprotein SlyB
MKVMYFVVALPFMLLAAEPAVAQNLSSKEKQRVARADPRDQDAVYNCLMAKKKGAKTGTIAGGAAGVAGGVIGGASVGGTIIAGAVGAGAGRLLGQGTSTNSYCDDVLKRNK